MNINEVSYEDAILVCEQLRGAENCPKEFIYLCDSMIKCCEILNAVEKGVQSISILGDDQENLTYEGFLRLHENDKKFIKKVINELEMVQPLYGTKTTYRNMVRSLSNLFSSFEFVFGELCYNGSISQFGWDDFLKGVTKVKQTANLYLDNCCRRFKINLQGDAK